MPDPQSPVEVLDRDFLNVRARLIEVAASLDRIDRADPDGSLRNDPRTDRIRKSIDVLSHISETNRAEQVLRVFSDEYDPNWSLSE